MEQGIEVQKVKDASHIEDHPISYTDMKNSAISRPQQSQIGLLELKLEKIIDNDRNPEGKREYKFLVFPSKYYGISVDVHETIRLSKKRACARHFASIHSRLRNSSPTLKGTWTLRQHQYPLIALDHKNSKFSKTIRLSKERAHARRFANIHSLLRNIGTTNMASSTLPKLQNAISYTLRRDHWS